MTKRQIYCGMQLLTSLPRPLLFIKLLVIDLRPLNFMDLYFLRFLHLRLSTSITDPK